MVITEAVTDIDITYFVMSLSVTAFTNRPTLLSFSKPAIVYSITYSYFGGYTAM